MKKILAVLLSCLLLTSCQENIAFILKDLAFPFFCYLVVTAVIFYAFVWLCHKSVLAAKSNDKKAQKKWWLITLGFTLLVVLLVLVALGQVDEDGKNLKYYEEEKQTQVDFSEHAST